MRTEPPGLKGGTLGSNKTISRPFKGKNTDDEPRVEDPPFTRDAVIDSIIPISANE
jgi:hypothetical protein